MTSVLGKNYTTNKDVFGPTAVDFEIIYNNMANFHFYQNKLVQVILVDVNKAYYENIFNNSQHIKIQADESPSYLYIKESDQLIKSQLFNNKHYVYLLLADPNFHYSYGEYIQ